MEQPEKRVILVPEIHHQNLAVTQRIDMLHCESGAEKQHGEQKGKQQKPDRLFPVRLLQIRLYFCILKSSHTVCLSFSAQSCFMPGCEGTGQRSKALLQCQITFTATAPARKSSVTVMAI